MWYSYSAVQYMAQWTRYSSWIAPINDALVRFVCSAPILKSKLNGLLALPSEFPHSVSNHIQHIFLLLFSLTTSFTCFVHSFPWRLDVVSYAYFDANFKSQYDLRFLCTPGVILQESKQELVVNRGGWSVGSWLVAWWLNERGVGKYWESNVFLVGWLAVIWYLAVYP